MDTSNIKIETGRLVLKGVGLDYVDDTFREFTSEITEYMYPKPPDKIENTIEFIKSAIQENKDGSDLNVVVLLKENGEFLGRGGLHHINKETPELGIWIKKSAHGNGYGKEAMVALKEWADNNLKYKYILYPVAVQNHPSRKIPEFLGGEIKREYDEVNLSGKEIHLLEYRIYPMKNSSVED